MGWTPNLVWQTRLFMLGPLLTLWTSCQCTPGYGYTLPCRWQAFSCLWTCAQDIPSVSPPNPSPPSLMTNTICILKPIFPWHPSPKHFACPLHAHSTFIYATVTAPIKLYCNSCVHTSFCHETAHPWWKELSHPFLRPTQRQWPQQCQYIVGAQCFTVY